jgi:glycerophosphoryl diester phosphodiesterase
MFKKSRISLENNQNLDGKSIIDWFVSDFTLPEIKKLRAKQAFAKVRNSTTINMQSSL